MLSLELFLHQVLFWVLKVKTSNLTNIKVAQFTRLNAVVKKAISVKLLGTLKPELKNFTKCGTDYISNQPTISKATLNAMKRSSILEHLIKNTICEKV